jgi:hypothetical protein
VPGLDDSGARRASIATPNPFVAPGLEERGARRVSTADANPFIPPRLEDSAERGGSTAEYGCDTARIPLAGGLFFPNGTGGVLPAERGSGVGLLAVIADGGPILGGGIISPSSRRLVVGAAGAEGGVSWRVKPWVGGGVSSNECMESGSILRLGRPGGSGRDGSGCSGGERSIGSKGVGLPVGVPRASSSVRDCEADGCGGLRSSGLIIDGLPGPLRTRPGRGRSRAFVRRKELSALSLTTSSPSLFVAVRRH